MIWLVLGGAVGVWREMSEAYAMLATPPRIIAVNDAGVSAPRLDAWATLHNEKFHQWMNQREAKDYKAFSITNNGPWTQVRDKWAGSSGLYAVQIALQELGASGVILCGCPLNASARHFFDKNNDWSEADVYRKGFRAAFPVICDKVRSMSGWTQELLGAPNSQWLTDRA